jgi:hypothetical protein
VAAGRGPSPLQGRVDDRQVGRSSASACGKPCDHNGRRTRTGDKHGLRGFLPAFDRRSRCVLGRAGQADRLADAARADLRRQQASVLQLVRRRQDQPVPQRGRPAPRHPGGPGGADLRFHRRPTRNASTPSASCTTSTAHGGGAAVAGRRAGATVS